MGRVKHVCPVCGQPVGTIVGRHKTLGAWVPVWAPGPCHNPDCEAYGGPAEPAAPESGTDDQPRPEESSAKEP
ncbi:hypothetical protein ABZ865_14535 [Streptomyces sp. NPDC047085]|uniref:hypothetical protein n=1 Tax=Streptomyces sp. NPDC047085 TaxID=3155140 RepID=UPI0033E632EF